MRIRKLVIVITILFLITLLYIGSKVEAVEVPEGIPEEVSEQLQNMTSEDILEIYDQITEQYSNDEIADMISENKEQIAQEAGVSTNVLDAGAEFIRNTNQEDIRNILENDESINQIRETIQEGGTASEAVENAIANTTTSQKIELIVKILFANNIVKIVIWTILILFIYCTITRWIVYNKAGKNGFAAIIPFYRQITMYKICGLSPLLMLLWLIPIFGWIVMFIIAIMKRILLAQNFGRGGLFGIGILILPPIFYSILAFNPNIEYEGEEE